MSGVDLLLEKSGLHPRNQHRGQYNFDQLLETSPELAHFVKLNAYHNASIDFANPQAVKALNRALRLQFYGIHDWDIPAGYLCPPIPGRADYLHHVADLLALGGNIPTGEQVRALDVGVGANVIYPLIGQRMYGWRFVGSDIDATALANARRIVKSNALDAVIELRLQVSPVHIFKGIIGEGETFDLSLCNPPFHASIDEASAGSRRKWHNLGRGGAVAPRLNFGGQGAELYCEGGEQVFIRRMIQESVQFAPQCRWFTTLVSKAASLPCIYRALKQAGVADMKTIDMTQGQKRSRIVAWTFVEASSSQDRLGLVVSTP